jgi:hypothetical protein
LLVMMMMVFLNDTTRPWLSVTRPSSRICTHTTTGQPYNTGQSIASSVYPESFSNSMTACGTVLRCQLRRSSTVGVHSMMVSRHDVLAAQ